MQPDCFGREYYDGGGGECPYHECLLRYECKQVFLTAEGLLKLNKAKEEVVSPYKKVPPQRIAKKRAGYVKPGRLLYKDEGTLRDKLIFYVRDYLESSGYTTKSTKCLHSFVGDDGKFILKVDTRRKNSILLYITDELSDLLMEEGFRCRALFDSERPNFPSYLLWVVTLRGEGDVQRFQEAFEELRGKLNDS